MSTPLSPIELERMFAANAAAIEARAAERKRQEAVENERLINGLVDEVIVAATRATNRGECYASLQFGDYKTACAVRDALVAKGFTTARLVDAYMGMHFVSIGVQPT